MKTKLLGILLSGLFVLSCLEIGLRLFGPFQRAGKSPDNILWQTDPVIGFAPAANLNTVLYTNEWSNAVRTNEFGFRIGDTAPVSMGSTSDTMLFLGDSQTSAVQVPTEATYVSLIEKELVGRGRSMRVVNAGCNVFNTVQEYLFFKKLYDHGMRPRFVVMYVTNNDLFEDVPGLPYGRYDVSADGYVVPAQPDAELLSQLKRAKETPPRQANVWLVNSALIRHLWYSYRVMRNPGDVAGWVKNIYLRDDLDPSASGRWAVATAAIRSLNSLVSSYGGMLIIAVHPDPVEWSDAYYARLMKHVPELSGKLDRLKLQRGYRKIAENVGARFVDMLNGFPNVSVREFRFAMDPHSNSSGHRIIALQLLKGFERVGLLD